MEDIVTNFTQALLSMDRLATKKIMNEQSDKYSTMEFIEKIVVVSLERIGKGWQEGAYALSQVYMSGRICEELIDKILPPGDPDRKKQPKIAICVLTDQHKLGKTIVYSLLRASGFEVADFDVMEVDDLVNRVKTEKIEFLFISVLMLPSALKVKKVKQKLNTLDHPVKIIVGGAPFRFDEKLWKQVGADAMGKTASEAISAMERLTGGTQHESS